MDAFIYCADIYCADCARKIRKALDKQGKRPADVGNESSYDSDQYPKGPYPEGGGEADSVQFCADCRTCLDNPLTDAGVRNAVDILARAPRRTQCGRDIARVLADYTGEPGVEKSLKEFGNKKRAVT